MNVYEFKTSEREWVCANTTFEALIIYLTTTGMDISDFNKSDDIIVLPPSEWDNYEIVFEDDELNMTIAEYMKDATEPDIICTTCI